MKTLLRYIIDDGAEWDRTNRTGSNIKFTLKDKDIEILGLKKRELKEFINKDEKYYTNERGYKEHLLLLDKRFLPFDI